MNQILFSLKTAADDFRRNKMRTLLTSLGILIGISSVVLLMSFGLGLKAYINQQFESLGANLIYVMPGDFSAGFSGGFQRSMALGIRFDIRDYNTVKRIKSLKAIVPVYVNTYKLKGEKDTESYEVDASTNEIFDIMNIRAEYGTLFTKSDSDKGSKKAVLGPNVAKKLFGSAEAAVGKKITIENVSFTVAGVTQVKGGGGMGPSIDDQLYIPYKSAVSFNPDKKFFALYAQAENKDDIPRIKTEIRDALEKRYEADDFSVIEQTEFLTTISSIFNVLNMVLVAIAGISLIVGGIGIMNIMFVSVVERIREIGIRRAIGARKQDILYQFLTESVLLSVFGGVAALALSFGIVTVIQNFFPAYIDAMTVGIALAVSSAVGIVFGVMPAKRAADLSPIDAIRYE